MTPAAAFLAVLAVAAPRLPYGGEVAVVTWGAAAVIDPAWAGRAADRSAASMVFEPLYRVHPNGAVSGVLAAELPRFEGLVARIPLRPNTVTHDGRPLTASMVAAALSQLGDGRSAAAHVLLPIAGGVARLNGDAGSDVGIRGNDATHTIEIRLAVAYPELSRLLASPRAAIVVRRDRRLVGTGPFAIDAGASSVRLVPHLRHRGGRPFLDRVVLRVAPTVFAARARLRRERAAIAFDLPEVRGGVKIAGPLPESLVVLAVGRRNPELAAPAVTEAIDAAINRRVLARRYLRGDRTAAATLLGDPITSSRAPPAAPSRLRVELLVASDRPPGLRFAERLQLDLHRAGISAVIEQVDAPELDRRRRSGDYELILDTVPLEAAPVRDPTDSAHRLAALAATWGAPTVVGPSELAAMTTGRGSQRRRSIRRMEREVRRRTGLIPIAVVRSPVWQKAALTGVRLSGDGGLGLANAFMERR